MRKHTWQRYCTFPRHHPVHSCNRTKPHRTQRAPSVPRADRYLAAVLTGRPLPAPAARDLAIPRPCYRRPAGQPSSLSSSSSGELSPASGRRPRLARPPEQRTSTRLPPLVQKAPARARPGAVRTANVKLGVPALLAYVDLRDVRLADFGTGEVDPGVALVTLDHRPPGERLHAEASD